jgi:hypothetical protein
MLGIKMKTTGWTENIYSVIKWNNLIICHGLKQYNSSAMKI